MSKLDETKCKQRESGNVPVAEQGASLPLPSICNSKLDLLIFESEEQVEITQTRINPYTFADALVEAVIKQINTGYPTLNEDVTEAIYFAYKALKEEQ